MQQTVFAGQNADERPEVDDARNFTVVDLADLGLRRNLLDLGDRGISAFSTIGIDAYRTVVIDVHVRAGLVDNGANRRAALTDDVANLVRMNLEDRHRGRIL